MKIMIEYESSWRNSFLDGDNNTSLPKKGRNFIGSMKAMTNPENFIVREITKDTVMGILNRLIGDQRKLYQSRIAESYYFRDLEDDITFTDVPKYCNEGTQEMLYISSKKGSTDQKSFTGMIKSHIPIFTSDYSVALWGVLFLQPDELFDFIINKKLTNNVEIGLDPLSIMNRLMAIQKMKPLENKDEAQAASQLLAQSFSEYKPLNKKEKLLMLPLYCSALYLQLERLAEWYNMEDATSKRGRVSGISHNGFTYREFMYQYTTGKKRIIYGNPYVHQKYVQGEGKVNHWLIKASGQLCINIDIDIEGAKQLQTQIENAGVSAFYVGKKGLAYVSNIDVDEEQTK